MSRFAYPQGARRGRTPLGVQTTLERLLEDAYARGRESAKFVSTVTALRELVERLGADVVNDAVTRELTERDASGGDGLRRGE